MHFFAYFLRTLPVQYESLDTNRLTLAHFCVQALDLLGVWDDSALQLQQQLTLDKTVIIEWIYSLQSDNGGFIGGTFLGTSSSTAESCSSHNIYNHGHIAMTYTALATLKTLGDDLQRVDRQAILATLPKLQRSDGSFQCVVMETTAPSNDNNNNDNNNYSSEHDLRFLYCACSISHMLQDWSGIDQDRAVHYIQQCRNPIDGSFALVPGGQEGHGGSTFCAVASLTLMGRLKQVLDPDSSTGSGSGSVCWRNELIRWCVHRQVGGMQGRPNKVEDTCYSFWIGGTLRLLGHDDLLDHTALRTFVMKCQTSMGGFSKTIGEYPDLLHSFYSMAYLSWSQRHFADQDDPWNVQLKMLNCTLGICNDRAILFDGSQHFP